MLLKDLFIRKSYRKRERPREIFYLLVHSLNGHKGWSWARQKPRAQNFI